MKVYGSIIALVACLNAFGQSKLVKQIMQQLQTKTTYWCTDLIVEKTLPYSKTESVVVLPEYTDTTDRSFSLKTWILVVDKTTGKIKNKTFATHDSDAMNLERFEIDTAPYQLSAEARAFGIRVSYRNQSRANPHSYKTLTLYLRSGTVLKSVLTDFTIEHFSGESDASCAGDYINKTTVLIMTEHTTNGYFDIVAKTEIVNEIAFVDKTGKCDSTATSKNEKHTLKYQNGQYK